MYRLVALALKVKVLPPILFFDDRRPAMYLSSSFQSVCHPRAETVRPRHQMLAMWSYWLGLKLCVGRGPDVRRWPCGLIGLREVPDAGQQVPPSRLLERVLSGDPRTRGSRAAAADQEPQAWLAAGASSHSPWLTSRHPLPSLGQPASLSAKQYRLVVFCSGAARQQRS